MKKVIMTVMSVFFVLTFIGCATYSHTQAVRNETGVTVKEVYIRDTGTADWGKVRNVQARRDSEGRVIVYQDGSVAYWDRTDMNNATQMVLFDGGYSETPRAIGNKDILMVDSNGVVYMKNNVPITFTTTKSKHMFDFQGETLTTSAPITFTAKDRLPMLYVVNQTGYALNLIAPVKQSIADKGRAQFQPREMNRSIDVTYTIGQAQYTEQVNMKNEDATVTLTKRPPKVTIANNTGSTVNVVMVRTPGTGWAGPNVLNLQLNADGTLAHAQAGVQTNELRGSITNRESFIFWVGNLSISGNVFDIRVDDVQGNSFVKSNIQINNDMTVTFTQSDKR